MLVQSPVNIYWMSKEKNSVPWSCGLKGHELSKLSCLGCLSSFCKYCNESFFSIYRIMPLSIADLVIIMRHDDMAVNRKLVQFLFIHFIIFFSSGWRVFFKAVISLSENEGQQRVCLFSSNSTLHLFCLNTYLLVQFLVHHLSTL